MSEGSGGLNKALVFLVLAGIAAGGYYLYTTWPVTYDGPGYEVKLPNKWKPETQANGMTAKGPLKDAMKNEIEGYAFVKLEQYGALDWPKFALDQFPEAPDPGSQEEFQHQGMFKAMVVTYTSGPFRYRGIAIARNSVMVTYAIGCSAAAFDANKEAFDKLVRDTKVMQ